MGETTSFPAWENVAFEIGGVLAGGGKEGVGGGLVCLETRDSHSNPCL